MTKYDTLKKLFEENANAENAVSMSKYMRDKFSFYGIPSAKRKELTRPFIKEEKVQKAVDWAFLDACYADEHRELQYFVNDCLDALKKYLTYEDIPHLYRYAKAKQWWDTIDFLDRIIGSIGLCDRRVDELMLKWSVDADIWMRRLAIDHQIGRKEKTNTALLERIIVNNFGSKEFFVNKAIGWSLREYAKTDPEWIMEFLFKYRDRMDKLSVREAGKHLIH